MNANAATPPSSADSNMDASSGTTTPSSPPASPKPWSGFGYESVPGLANRLISRYLRSQRHNMERFFQERGLLESAERMRQIRLSRQGMMAKNRMFQEVLGEYARGATATAVPEAANLEVGADTDVGLQDTIGQRLAGHGDGVGADGIRPDAGSSVPVVAVEDSGPVIQE
jgi:hypothetical protein